MVYKPDRCKRVYPGRGNMIALSVRLAEQMYEALKEKAEEEQRSLNGQINYMLSTVLKKGARK